MSRPLLFYSFFPLGYHNVEAERKAVALSNAGYDVLYATAPLIRNPRPSDLGRLLRHARRRLRPSPAGSDLRSSAFTFLPPRQLDVVRRVNAVRVERRVRRAFDDGAGLVAWIRWPTAEVVAALPRLQPAAVVYECVDSYWETPGVTGRWQQVYESSERRLVQLADVVVATNERIAERFRGLGTPVRLLPHGVDLLPPTPPRPEGPVVLGFVGSLDYRIDLEVVRHLAEAHPEWRLRLIGPLQRGFARELVSDLPNVALEAPVPHDRLGETLAEFDVGLMPYFDHPVFHHMSPVKNLELLAAGKPAVSRPSAALQPFGELLYFATTPEEFVAATERALAEDDAERAARRREVAALHTWARRHEQMLELIDWAIRRRSSADLTRNPEE